ncbi:MAG: pentapeptide repeat-containing protein [Isosphaerales bacterium]
MNAEQNSEIWNRLIQGMPLEGLGLGERHGRLDLKGLRGLEPFVSNTIHTPVGDAAVLGGLTKLRGAAWKSLDFSGSRLNDLKFFDSTISDCVFDKCRCRNWGLWGTKVSDTSFRSANLRESALGGVAPGTWNTFLRVDFTAADLRGTAYGSPEFVGCTFKDTRLAKVDFDGSRFTDCSFKGELKEVCFNRTSFMKGLEDFPPNEMLRVDLSHAQLRDVEFRELDLETVKFPADADHIVLENYPDTLDRLIEAFKGQTGLGSRGFAAYLACYRKWAGPRQKRGVLNKKDVLGMVGEEGLRRTEEIVESNRG